MLPRATKIFKCTLTENRDDIFKRKIYQKPQKCNNLWSRDFISRNLDQDNNHRCAEKFSYKDLGIVCNGSHKNLELT